MTNSNYVCKILESNGEFDAYERVMCKDLGDAIPMDDATQQGSVVIEYEKHLILGIHNEKSEDKDYEKCVVVDPEGRKFVCGSATFRRELENIVAELSDAGISTGFNIKVYRKASNNYKGKDFITCSLTREKPTFSTAPDDCVLCVDPDAQ
jgi:hypothetical protein|nr:MAG TPA: ssDNA binding protein [Caudoviricetes sp.]